jgi:hypothetical protein
MAQCPFFRTQTSYVKRAAPPGRMGAAPLIPVERCWCAHPKHSPVPEANAKATLGGAIRLVCGGDLAHCQVPAGLFNDQR